MKKREFLERYLALCNESGFWIDGGCCCCGNPKVETTEHDPNWDDQKKHLEVNLITEEEGEKTKSISN